MLTRRMFKRTYRIDTNEGKTEDTSVSHKPYWGKICPSMKAHCRKIKNSEMPNKF